MPEDADHVQYFYKVSSGQIDLYKTRDVAAEDAEKAKRDAALEEERMIMESFHNITELMFNLRREFVVELTPTDCKKGFPAIARYMACAADDNFDLDLTLIGNILGVELSQEFVDSSGKDWYKILDEDGVYGTMPEKVLLALAYSSMDSSYCGYWSTGGRERETDEEFRDRYYASVDYAGGVNADSIRAALLQNVDGIMEAKVFENDTDDVDDYGLPPHSIEAVVYGGLDSDIAQIIYKELGAGIQTTGQKVVEVITASGATKAIHFNRPHPVPVYVKVVGLSTSGDFPHDGVDQLRAAIVAYIGDNESGGVSIGETLYHQRLPAVLYKVPGVLDFDVLIGTDAENLQADNIPVDSRSKVVTDDGMVTIDA